jgi:Fic family protein
VDPNDFKDPSVGTLVPTINGQKAFVPAALPPTIDIREIQQTLSEADQKLGELRGIGAYLHNPYLLIRPLQRSEAIASSNIEGTFTSLPELLLLEVGAEDQSRTSDTREVLNYIRALQQGVERLNELPVSTRLILELHKTLLQSILPSRRGHFTPGEFRTAQNFIGRQRDINKARFIPPPPPLHLECMSDLEKFIHSESYSGFPPLVFLAMIHYQFETIHPFPDGNGRVGRLLIPLILKEKNIMPEPLLYMSQYFEDHKDQYIDLMLAVSQKGTWLEWIDFFLKGIVASCGKTIETIGKIQGLRREYMERCQQARSSALLVQIVEGLFERPVTSVPAAKLLTGTSYRAAKNNLEKLVQCGILSARQGEFRPKYYLAPELIDIFAQ